MMSTELIKIEELNALEVFKEGGIDPILKAIESEVIGFIPDVTTPKGQEEIKSRAYKVSRSKTAIDALGKDLADDLNNKLKPINAERKKARDFLDSLKDRVRQPLTDMENREKERVLRLKERLSSLDIEAELDGPVQSLKGCLNYISCIDVDATWEEFQPQAEALKNSSIQKLKGAILLKEAEEKERIEAIKAQQEKELKERAEREANIKREAEERAELQRIEAARKAEADLQAVKDKAEADRLAAITAKESAIQAERQRIEAEQKAKEQEEIKRAANKEHKAKINNEVLAAFCKSLSLDEVNAKEIVIAIASGEIPHVKIQY
jgi:hypothetical protein